MRDNTYKRLQARYGKSRREIARTLVRSRNELLIRFFEENIVLINNDYFLFGSFAMSQLVIGFALELSSAELFWSGDCWESLVQSLIVRTLTVDIPSSVEGLDFS